MQTITVKTGRPYDVLIGQDILSRCGKQIKSLPGQHCQKVAVITDNQVDSLYGDAVRGSLEQAGFTVCTYAFPNGEGSKNMSTVMDAIAFLCDNHVTRSDLIVALGGGVVGDLAGFAAAIYQRGIDYVQIPTTLLAAVDSSVGGKTAVNIPAGKNLVGCFWQPRLVVCDTNTMDTLPGEVFGDGVAETIKYGCIWDQALFDLMEREDIRAHLEEVVARCIDIKAQVVMQDERDNGLRQILNFGHTTGHAIEKLSGFTLSHGKGVAIGMCIAAAAGEAAGVTPAGTAARIRAVLIRHNLPVGCDYNIHTIADACLGDKKRSGDTINLILLQQIGKALLHPMETTRLEAFLSAAERG